MDGAEKKTRAVEFLGRLAEMESAELAELIRSEAGEELSELFVSYTQQVLGETDPQVTARGSTLMMLGYLLRGSVDRAGD